MDAAFRYAEGKEKGEGHAFHIPHYGHRSQQIDPFFVREIHDHLFTTNVICPGTSFTRFLRYYYTPGRATLIRTILMPR